MTKFKINSIIKLSLLVLIYFIGNCAFAAISSFEEERNNLRARERIYIPKAQRLDTLAGQSSLNTREQTEKVALESEVRTKAKELIEATERLLTLSEKALRAENLPAGERSAAEGAKQLCRDILSRHPHIWETRDGVIRPRTKATNTSYVTITRLTDVYHHTMQRRMYRAGLEAQYQGMRFGAEYGTFMTAIGFLTVYQMATSYETNPNGIKAFTQALTDPMGMASFGVFMAVNHPVSKALDGVLKGRFSKNLIPYIGMSAGFLASHLFSDFFSDRDAMSCAMQAVTPHISDRGIRFKNMHEIASCEAAYARWGLSKKIVKYLPSMASLLGSAGLAALGQYGVTLAAPNISKVLFQSFEIFKVGTRVIRVTPVTMLAFVAIDQIIAPRISYLWEDVNLSAFDFQAELDRNILHRDYWNPRDPTKIPPYDAFDVEATNLASTIRHMNDFERTMTQNQTNAELRWFQPRSYTTCGPQNFSERPRNAQPWQMPGFNWATLSLPVMGPFSLVSILTQPASQRKPDDQLRCEVQAQPLKLLDRYFEANRKWRKHLLTEYDQGQYNWLTWAADFDTTLSAYREIVGYIADEKYFTELAERRGERYIPDLSPQTIFSLVNPGDLEETKRRQVGEAWSNNIVDYTLLVSACGHMGAPANMIQLGFMGGSIEFLAPKVTTDPHGMRCYPNARRQADGYRAWAASIQANQPGSAEARRRQAEQQTPEYQERMRQAYIAEARRRQEAMSGNQAVNWNSSVDAMAIIESYERQMQLRHRENSPTPVWLFQLFTDESNPLGVNNDIGQRDLVAFIFDNLKPEIYKHNYQSRNTNDHFANDYTSNFISWFDSQILLRMNVDWEDRIQKYKKLVEEKAVPILEKNLVQVANREIATGVFLSLRMQENRLIRINNLIVASMRQNSSSAHDSYRRQLLAKIQEGLSQLRAERETYQKLQDLMNLQNDVRSGNTLAPVQGGLLNRR